MSERRGEALRKAFEEASQRAQASVDERTRETVSILTFSLSGEWYGFRLKDLVEITGLVEPTPIPFTPAFIPGVINHRGTVVPVVDLKRVFGLSGRLSSRTGRIVLVRHEESIVGFQADAISDLVSVPPEAIEPTLSTIERRKAEYLEGCIRDVRGLLVLLDSRALVEDLRTDE